MTASALGFDFKIGITHSAKASAKPRRLRVVLPPPPPPVWDPRADEPGGGRGGRHRPKGWKSSEFEVMRGGCSQRSVNRLSWAMFQGSLSLSDRGGVVLVEFKKNPAIVSSALPGIAGPRC